MAVSTPYVLRVALRRRYIALLFLAALRGYVNLVLDMTKYVGTGRANTNKAQIRLDMLIKGDASEYVGLWMAHETDVPPRDASPFPNWMEGQLGRCSRLGLDRLKPL